MRILTVRPRDPLVVGGGVKFFYQEISLCHQEKSHGEISLGDHEISHGEISPGHQENLLVNKFPVLTPPPNFRSRRSRGEFIYFSCVLNNIVIKWACLLA